MGNSKETVTVEEYLAKANVPLNAVVKFSKTARERSSLDPHWFEYTDYFEWIPPHLVPPVADAYTVGDLRADLEKYRAAWTEAVRACLPQEETEESFNGNYVVQCMHGLRERLEVALAEKVATELLQRVVKAEEDGLFTEGGNQTPEYDALFSTLRSYLKGLPGRRAGSWVPRYCVSCGITHVENCPRCFGFGFKRGKMIPVIAAEAAEWLENSLLFNFDVCPACGSGPGGQTFKITGRKQEKGGKE